MTSKVIQGHIRILFCQNHSSTFVYGTILMKICMNANFMKSEDTIYDLKCHFYVMEKFCDFFTLRPSDLITTLTNVLSTTFVLVFFFDSRIKYLYILQQIETPKPLYFLSRITINKLFFFISVYLQSINLLSIVQYKIV